MGYYTNYSLSIEKNEFNTKDIFSYIKEQYKTHNKFYPFAYCFEYYEGKEISSIDFNGEYAKWYDHDDEMLELSKQFPETVFCLYGEGEASEDMWYTYYKNGKLQHCPAKITFDEYDESKLE